MKFLLGILVFNILSGLLAAAEPAQPSKNSALLKLVHNTAELKEFKVHVAEMIDFMKAQPSEVPASLFDEAGREMNSDGYARWLVSMFDKGLSLPEIHALNHVFGNPAKKALLEKMMQELKGKKGDDFVKAVAEFRKSNKKEIADELIEFMQTPAAKSYAVVLDKISEGRSAILSKLYSEAIRRVAARYR